MADALILDEAVRSFARSNPGRLGCTCLGCVVTIQLTYAALVRPRRCERARRGYVPNGYGACRDLMRQAGLGAGTCPCPPVMEG